MLNRITKNFWGIVLGTGILIIAYIAWGASSASNTDNLPASPPPAPTEPVACTMEAKICPDGSSVGRIGPNCEFAACPSIDATSAAVTTYLGGRAAGLGVTVNPFLLVSDSRCPQDVQCVWAGTVEVRTVTETPTSRSEHVFKLNETQTIDGFSVTLTEVTPFKKTSSPIADSAYRFTFEIKKQ